MEYYSIMDKKDIKIITVLEENAKLSTKKIAKRVQLPITTVHNRIKKLEQQKIIKGYTVQLDYKQLGKGLSAFILISVDLKLLKTIKKTQYDIIKSLERISTIHKVNVVIGRADLIVHMRVKDLDELDKVLLGEIQLIDGISDTQTNIVLREKN